MAKQPIKIWISPQATVTKALLVTCSLLALASTSLAQQITGTPGSPSATITIDDKLTFNLGPTQLTSNEQKVMRHALEKTRD